jgi:hypothetical protein
LFVSRNGRWLISLPSEKDVRLKVPSGQNYRTLFDLGYDLKPVGSNTRIAAGRFMAVRVYAFQIPLGK